MKQRYESYKPSSIEWIGDIPSHWDLYRMKYLAKLKSGNTLSSEDIDPENGQFPVFGGNGIRGYYSNYNYCGRNH